MGDFEAAHVHPTGLLFSACIPSRNDGECAKNSFMRYTGRMYVEVLSTLSDPSPPAGTFSGSAAFVLLSPPPPNHPFLQRPQ
jgi:hypothetical protein